MCFWIALGIEKVLGLGPGLTIFLRIFPSAIIIYKTMQHVLAFHALC